MTLLWSLDNRGPIMIKRRSSAPTWTILTLNCKDKFTYNYVLIKWLLWFTSSSKLISNHDRLFLLHYKMFAGVCQAGSGVCWSRGTFVGLDIFPELGYIFFSRWVQSWRLHTGLPLLLITVMLEQRSLRNDHWPFAGIFIHDRKNHSLAEVLRLWWILPEQDLNPQWKSCMNTNSYSGSVPNCLR